LTRSRCTLLLVPALTVLALALLSLAGCGTANPHGAGTYQRGAVYFEKGKHERAVDAFAQFLRRSPSDSLAPQAQLLKARSYMEMGEYPLAAVELQILRQEYPTSDEVEEAYFLEGVAYYEQLGRVERDVSAGYDARNIFRNYVETFPDSPRVDEARTYLRRISDLIVRKQLGVADVYGRLKRWEAVAIVLDRTIETERDSQLRDSLYWRRAEVARRLDQPATAVRLLRRLVREYPESHFAGRARNALADLSADAGEGEDDAPDPDADP